MVLADELVEQGRANIFEKGAKEPNVYLGKSLKRSLWRCISLARAKPALEADNVFLSEDAVH